MKVSVIIPVYNAERCVSESVKNCKKQTFEDFEVIFVDDCSTDETVKIIEEEIKGDRRFRLIKLNENRRQGYARNIGLENAIGEYVMFFDVDDEYSPEFIEKMYNKITRDKADITGCKFLLTDKNSGEILENTDFALLSDFPKDFYDGFCPLDIEPVIEVFTTASTVWDKIYSRKFLNENNIVFPTNLFNKEDDIFSFCAAFCAKKISVLDEYLYFYKLDKAKYDSSNFKQEEIFDCFDMFDYMRNYLRKVDTLGKYKNCFMNFEIFTLKYYFSILEKSQREKFFYRMRKSYERYKNLPQKIREEDSAMAALLDKVLETEEYTEEMDEYIKNF